VRDNLNNFCSSKLSIFMQLFPRLLKLGTFFSALDKANFHKREVVVVPWDLLVPRYYRGHIQYCPSLLATPTAPV